MFGLTPEKLLLVALIAAFLLGPTRLPHYASRLAKLTRSARSWLSDARTRLDQEMGPEFEDIDWKKLDPRQYDPRRIIREALIEDAPVVRAVPSVPAGPVPNSFDDAMGVRPTEIHPPDDSTTTTKTKEE